MSKTRQNNARDASAREQAAILRKLAPTYTGDAMRRRTLEHSFPTLRR
jgi:hypothetical protein